MHNKNMIGTMLRKNGAGLRCGGRIINFKTHNKQRKQSDELEEQEMMRKMNNMSVSGSGSDFKLKKLTPLKFNY
jgi:hypothetical protein